MKVETARPRACLHTSARDLCAKSIGPALRHAASSPGALLAALWPGKSGNTDTAANIRFGQYAYHDDRDAIASSRFVDGVGARRDERTIRNEIAKNFAAGGCARSWWRSSTPARTSRGPPRCSTPATQPTNAASLLPVNVVTDAPAAYRTRVAPGAPAPAAPMESRRWQ
jgi:hypothetical protein